MLSNKQEAPNWRFVPEINSYVDPAGMSLIERIRQEIFAEKWLGHKHGMRNLYKKGCRGPLCGKAMRDYGRTYQRQRSGYQRTRQTLIRQFDPLLAKYLRDYHEYLWQEDEDKKTEDVKA